MQLKPGGKVLAKWTDKNYYPAVISELTRNSKWLVIFEDGAKKALFDSELIAVPYLSSGQNVMITISNGFCAKGIIINHYFAANEELYYDIEYAKDDKRITERFLREDVFLTPDQASTYAVKPAKPFVSPAAFADVDLDNIVCGKRSRSKIGESNIASETTSSQKKSRHRKANSSIENIEISSKRFLQIKEEPDSQQRSSDILGISKSLGDEEREKLLGPLPKVGSQYFQGLAFLLTCGEREIASNAAMSNQHSNAERSTPFDSFYLRKQIEAAGGHVFDTLEEAKV